MAKQFTAKKKKEMTYCENVYELSWSLDCSHESSPWKRRHASGKSTYCTSWG
jgi:hypothetical protein